MNAREHHKIEDILPPSVASHFLGKAAAHIALKLEDLKEIALDDTDLDDVSRQLLSRISAEVYQTVDKVVGFSVKLNLNIHRVPALHLNALRKAGLSDQVTYTVHSSKTGQCYHNIRFLALEWDELNVESFLKGFSEMAPHIQLRT